MKKLLTIMTVVIASLTTSSSCNSDDEEINFIFYIGWLTDDNISEYDQFTFFCDGSGGMFNCPIYAGYYYGETYNPDKLRFIAPDKINITVEGEGFGFTDVSEEYGVKNWRWIKIHVDENKTSETRFGKLIVTASKSGKTGSYEKTLTQLPVSQED